MRSSIRGTVRVSRSHFAIALTILLGLTGATAAKAIEIELALDAHDPNVADLIWWGIAGQRDHPLPNVYFSTDPFHVMRNEFLVVLSRARYALISAYTQARISRSTCSGQWPRVVRQYTVEVAEHHSDRARHCAMPYSEARAFLSGVEGLSGINWTANERKPISEVLSEVGCTTVEDREGTDAPSASALHR
jgi:hypothetical protein